MKSVYHKIKGVGTGRGTPQPAQRARLYAGPDHLLIIYHNGYSEDYKRVFYRDIRYLVARRTHGQLIGGIVALVVLLLCALLFLIPGAFWAGVVFSSLPLLWLVSIVVRGPTCRCFVNTAVQTIQLPAPTRIGKVPALIDFLQARLASEAVPAPDPHP